MDRHQFVQQYVERQRAYLPTYTTKHLFDDSVPHKSLQDDDDGFGFDTPVLRPRVPAKEHAETPTLPQAGPSRKSPRNEVQRRDLRASPASEIALRKGKKKSKRKKSASTPIGDSDSERAARLADRRERKRNKRAIVNPPVPAPASKKGTKNQRSKKPAALALLYGFTATNVTKDRLTLKPAPSLGVFGKGKASEKKQVAPNKKTSSRHEWFSESAFLNKSVEQDAEPSIINGGSDDDDSNGAKQDGSRRINKELKTAPVPTRATAESEDWDIEVQSKLPSSAPDISSELGETDSAPVVIDMRRAGWSASLDMAAKGYNKPKTPNMIITRSLSKDEIRLARAADEVSSIHPSHSASQVGCHVADHPPCGACPMATSKHFVEPKPILATNPPRTSGSNDGTSDLRRENASYLTRSAQEVAAGPQWPSRSNDLGNIHSRTSTDFTVLESTAVRELTASPQPLRLNDEIHGYEIPNLAADYTALYPQTIQQVTWQVNSLSRPTATFETRNDMAESDLTNDCLPYDNYYREGDWGPCFFVEPHQGDDLGYWTRSGLAAAYDVDAQGYGPEYEYDLQDAVSACFPEEDDNTWERQWVCVDETEQGFMEADGRYGEECVHEPGESTTDFLEGRALLLGMDLEEGRRMSGVVQAEMDVASRLRDHWRPLRL